MLRRGLWLPIGIHAGWNFTEEGVWGVANSGSMPHGLIQATLSGPDWLTGGDFGVEASLVGLLILGALGLLLDQGSRASRRDSGALLAARAASSRAGRLTAAHQRRRAPASSAGIGGSGQA